MSKLQVYNSNLTDGIKFNNTYGTNPPTCSSCRGFEQIYNDIVGKKKKRKPEQTRFTV
jgi:hypothetical protein